MISQRDGGRQATIGVVAGLAAWTVVLWPLHDLLPMWVEGMPAYLDQLLGVLRRACTPPVNVVEWRGRTLPLAIDAYQGPLMTYLDVPVARAWLGGLIDDPYAYRYKGIVLLALSGYLLFVLLRRIVAPAIAALGALVFVTLPAVAVTAIGDLQYHVPLLTAILAILVALVRYVDTRKAAWLFTTAFACGIALLTRAEALIWTAAALVAWIALEARGPFAAWWSTTRHKAWLAVGALVAFLLGAAPIVAMNLLFPDQGLLAFLTSGSSTADAGSLGSALVARALHVLRFILENRWDLYEVRVRHLVFVVVAATSVVALIVVAIRERRWPLSLVALVIVLPLSVVAANRGPREIHLLPLFIPVVAIITEVCGRLRPRYGAAILATTLAANIVVGALLLLDWQAVRARDPGSMTSNACPACLAKALEPYQQASLRFTNLGLYQEALWGSRAQACGENIMHWGNDAGFAQAVRNAVDDGGQVVFVGYPDGREGAMRGRVLRRAQPLATTLRAIGVGHREESVQGPDGRTRYLLTIVDGPPPRLAVTGGGVNTPAAGKVTGWVLGRGFRPGHKLTIDGVKLAPYFGHEGLVTFSIDASMLEGKDAIVVQVTSTDGKLRSAPFTIGLR